MACKHEGGSDACVRYRSGHCKTSTLRYGKTYHRENRERRNEYGRNYNALYMKSLWSPGTHAHSAGAAAEHLAAYSLYRRGVLELTWPDCQQSADDMHARFESGWFSVQVKTGRENKKTGRLSPKSIAKISSDIVAIVGLGTGRVEYLPNKKELPEELRMVQ